MMEAGDFSAGSVGAAWSTSASKRAAGGPHPAVARRHMTKQYANFQSAPRPGDREPIERLARGLPSTPAPGRSQVTMMHRFAGKPMTGSFAANTGKHAATIHVSAEGGKRAPALRGAPRTVAAQVGRNTSSGSNRVRMAGHLGGRGR